MVNDAPNMQNDAKPYIFWLLSAAAAGTSQNSEVSPLCKPSRRLVKGEAMPEQLH